MKSELSRREKKRISTVWIVDESKYLTNIEVQMLLGAARAEIKEISKENFNKIRNLFMIELGLHTGLRVSEMASLKHSNLFIEFGKSSIFVIGKGNKPRSVVISEQFKQICLQFIKLKEEFGFNINDNAYLLNKPSNERLTIRAFQKAFKNIILKSGLSNHYHIHNLRHTYTTCTLEASNHNYRFAQIQLGHASLKTTQIYAGALIESGKKALERLYNNDAQTTIKLGE